MYETSLFRNEPNHRTLAAGETLFERGDDAASMFAVVEGEIEIVRDGTVVEQLGPDQVFGELAILDHQAARTRAADARAADGGAVVVEVDQARFLSLVKLNPGLALLVMNHMAERIRRGW